MGNDIRLRKVIVHHGIKHLDSRATPPFQIGGPAARLSFVVEGVEITIDVAPLELIEFRARVRDYELLQAGASLTVVALALAFIESHPNIRERTLLPPQAVDVRDGDVGLWKDLFARARSMLGNLPKGSIEEIPASSGW